MTKLIKKSRTQLAVNECAFFFTESIKLLSMSISKSTGARSKAETAILVDFEKYFDRDKGLYFNPRLQYSNVFQGLLRIYWEDSAPEFRLIPNEWGKKAGMEMYNKIDADRSPDGNSKSSPYYLLSSEYAIKKLTKAAIRNIAKATDVEILYYQTAMIEPKLTFIKERLETHAVNEEYVNWYNNLYKCYYVFIKELKSKVDIPHISDIDSTFLLNLLITVTGLECRVNIKQKLIAGLIGSSERVIKGNFNAFRNKEGDDGRKQRLGRIADAMGDEELKNQLLNMYEKVKGDMFVDD